MPNPTDPTVRAVETWQQADLRRRAASRLSGAAATKGAPDRAVDALKVLHALASSPDTATGALTLLHELQVHQVELDLQAQELMESRAELESMLRLQTERLHALPIGCLTVDARGTVLEMNRTAAEMLGAALGEGQPLTLGDRLGADGAPRLLAALDRAAAGRPPAPCTLELMPPGGAARPVLASIGQDPLPGRYVVCLMALGANPGD